MTEFINMTMYVFKNINTIIKDNYYSFGIITFLLGILLGNYFSLWQQKRKEWNAIIEPIRNRLIKFRDRAISTEIKGHEIIDIRSHLYFWKRRGFDRAIQECNKSTSQENIKNGPYGFEYINEPKIIHANKTLLTYLKKK